jgi:anti-sigma factor RsiW
MTLRYACADVDELAGGLALGAVDADELAAARDHLETCPEPHAELRSLLGADAVLAVSSDPIEPSAGLRDRLMATVAATPQEVQPRLEPATTAAAPAAAEEPRAGRRGWLDWLSPNVARPLAVAAVVALIAVGVWGVSLSSQLNQQQQAQQALQQVVAAIAAGQPAHPVDGTAGRGYVVDPAGTGASFVVTDVSALDANQLYVLWLIGPDGTPVDVGAFEPGDMGVAVVPVEQDLSGFQTFAVTVESERVDAPTSDPVMVGTVQG